MALLLMNLKWCDYVKGILIDKKSSAVGSAICNVPAKPSKDDYVFLIGSAKN
jgi:hypothetical protein